MAKVEGPDFICIGLPRSGTGWLYDQLCAHRDFWMPPIKEIRYLDREVIRKPLAQARLERGKRRAGAAGERSAHDERDKGFLLEAAAMDGQPRDIARYRDWFRFKGDQLSGDITPSYVTLTDDDVIAEVGRLMPNVKIVFLVRDLVQRAWSGICKAHRAGRFDKDLLDDPKGFRDHIERHDKMERSRVTETIDRWKTNAPQVQFRYFFFDDLAKRPEWTRTEILTYLGADPEGGRLAADYNRKANSEKLDMPPAIEAELVDYFRDELKGCADRLGGHAKDWAARYGIQ